MRRIRLPREVISRMYSQFTQKPAERFMKIIDTYETHTHDRKKDTHGRKNNPRGAEPSQASPKIATF